ncbi:MAG: hypothetical protein ABI314_04985 [Gemmatimonadaceae bacterium]
MRVPTAEWDRPDSTSALSLWPPGFPAVIALPVFLGASPIQAARWINIVAAATTAALVVVLIAGPIGVWTGVIGAATVFATQSVFDTHISVLSEPIFIALLLVFLAVMVYARDRLLLMGVLAAAIVMVRYAGVAAPAAAVVWTLLDSRHDWGTRLRRTVMVAVLPVVVVALWVMRTAAAPDRHATQHLHVYGGWGPTLLQGRDTLAEWLAPLLADGTLQRIVALVLALVLAAFVVAAAADTGGGRWRKLRFGGVSTLLGATSLLALFYVLTILASRAFVGGTIPLDGRILAPLIVLMEIAVVTAVGHWWRAYHFPLHALITVVWLVWFGAAVTTTANDAIYATTEGSDFAGTRWRTSPLVAWVRDNARGRPVYSNWPPALYFYAHRIARELPDSTDAEDVSGFAEQLRADHGYVVGFDERSPDFMSPVTLARTLGLRQVVRTADGAVWAADSGAMSTPSAAPVSSALDTAGVRDSAARGSGPEVAQRRR